MASADMLVHRIFPCRDRPWPLREKGTVSGIRFGMGFRSHWRRSAWQTRCETGALPWVLRGRLPAPQMLVQARHDLDEVAGHVAIIELRLEDAVPGVLAGAGRAWQHEDEGGVDDAARRPALDRRCADLVVGAA